VVCKAKEMSRRTKSSAQDASKARASSNGSQLTRSWFSRYALRVWFMFVVSMDALGFTIFFVIVGGGHL